MIVLETALVVASIASSAASSVFALVAVATAVVGAVAVAAAAVFASVGLVEPVADAPGTIVSVAGIQDFLHAAYTFVALRSSASQRCSAVVLSPSRRTIAAAEFVAAATFACVDLVFAFVLVGFAAPVKDGCFAAPGRDGRCFVALERDGCSDTVDTVDCFGTVGTSVDRSVAVAIVGPRLLSYAVGIDAVVVAVANRDWLASFGVMMKRIESYLRV